MRFLVLLPILLLVASCSGTPVAPETELVLTSKFFKDPFVKFTTAYDIVNLVVPLNKLNFEDDDESSETESDVTLFFTLADVGEESTSYKGTYVFQNGTASKILDSGRSAAALNDDTKRVYIGGNGLYMYDGENGKLTEVGAIDDTINQVEADNQTGLIYYLTDLNVLYSVSDQDVTYKVEGVKNAQEFVLDFLSNIYFYDNHNDLYVFNSEGVTKFQLERPASSIKLIRPMFAQDEGVFAVIDDYLYLLYPSGKAEKSKLKLEVKPTAYAPEATLIQYYAYNKKIYEFNILEIMFGDSIPELNEFLKGNENEIKTIATRSRGSF